MDADESWTKRRKQLKRDRGGSDTSVELMDTEAIRSRRSVADRSRPRFAESSLTPLRVALDAVCIAGALAFALLLRFGFGWFEVTEASPPTVGFHALASVLWICGLLVALAFNRLYDEDTLFPGGGEVSRMLRSVIEAAAIMSVFVFLTQSFYISRSWFGLVIAFSLLFVGAERMTLRRRLASQREAGKQRRPAILVARTEEWDDWPFEDEHEFEVISRLDPTEFDSFLDQLQPDQDQAMSRAAVVLRARDFSHDEFWRILLSAGERGWSVFVHSPVRSVGRDRLTVREVAGQTIVKVAPPTLSGTRALQKRALDIAVSLLLLLLLSPLIMLIGVAVLIGSGRPVLYRQERVGLGGVPFDIIKFRSMPLDAENVTGPVWAMRADPRPTGVGRFLRRTSLDELPQLWNVLRGDMSLVGPRPERPSFVGEFTRALTWYRFRHRIRPGMTGWAQSHGLRGNTSIDSRVQFDNWYIENWSIWLDVKVLALTVREVIRGRAY